jgi:ribosomal protein S6--L-glutamate ligase
MKSNKVALAPFLRSCTQIVTLGIRAAIDDYSAAEKTLLRSAKRVFFPTPRFAYLFNALQIPSFPSYHTYRLQRSRVLQQILFACGEIPHPTTRIYFGKRQKALISKAFPFPLAAMGSQVALHKKHLVDNPAALETFCHAYNPVIIQEAVEWDTLLRILWVHADCVGAIKRDSSQGSDGSYKPVPIDHPGLGTVIEMMRTFARKAHLDDIVVEWGYAGGQWQVLEMGRPPVRWPLPKGDMLNRHHYLCELVKTERI